MSPFSRVQKENVSQSDPVKNVRSNGILRWISFRHCKDEIELEVLGR